MPEPAKSPNSPIIGIVGVCASGKSTISKLIKERGFTCRHIAQEHSYVPSMWQQITHPDFLIYLEASYPVTIERKKLNWTAKEYDEEVYRLRHAREHANLIISTDDKQPEEIANIVFQALVNEGFTPETP